PSELRGFAMFLVPVIGRFVWKRTVDRFDVALEIIPLAKRGGEKDEREPGHQDNDPEDEEHEAVRDAEAVNEFPEARDGSSDDHARHQTIAPDRAQEFSMGP